MAAMGLRGATGVAAMAIATGPGLRGLYIQRILHIHKAVVRNAGQHQGEDQGAQSRHRGNPIATAWVIWMLEGCNMVQHRQ